MFWIAQITQYFDNYYKQIRFIYKLLAFFGMLAYLGYHSLTGNNGYRAYKVIKKQVEQKQNELSVLRAEFEELKINVNHLSNKTLDLDLLEERCRIMLNYTYPDEIVIRSSTINHSEFSPNQTGLE